MTEVSQRKSMVWFLYDRDLRHEQVKGNQLRGVYIMIITKLFHDGGRYHIETSLDWFLYNNGLCHERVKSVVNNLNLTINLAFAARLLTCV